MKPIPRNQVILCLFYATLVLSVYFLIAKPAIETPQNIRIWADSLDYIEYAHFYTETPSLVSLGTNYVGPYFLLWIFNFNNELILIFNCSLLIFCLHLLFKYQRINPLLFCGILFANALLFTSLLLVNKEIFGFASMIFFITYVSSVKKRYLLLSIVFAILARWQQAAVIVLFILFENKNLFFKKQKLMSLLGFLLLVSVIFPFFGSNFSFITETSGDIIENQTNQSLGILPILNDLQFNYLYFVSFWLKTLFNLLGNLSQILGYISNSPGINWTDFYTMSILSHQYWTLCVLVALYFRGKFNLNHPLVPFVFIYSVIFSLNLFVQYRYFFPLCPVFLVILLTENGRTIPVKTQVLT
jgi:hypothetical protein